MRINSKMINMEIKVWECPKKTCKFRWVPRVNKPKECPNCKHRFTADWGLKPKSTIVVVKSADDLRKLKEEIAKWNDKDRWL
jgi:transcriptional regulator NrdR family protein